MSDPVIELEVQRPDDGHHGPRARWIVLSIVGVLIIAAVAIVAGRSQRPKPPPPHTYVSSPGFDLYTEENGDSLFEIVIHSYSGNPITVSMPEVTTLPGTENVQLMLTLDEKSVPTPISGKPWPHELGPVVIPAYGDAALGVSYHVGCGMVGMRGPFVTSARVEASAGSVRTVRNVMPVLNPSVRYGI